MMSVLSKCGHRIEPGGAPSRHDRGGERHQRSRIRRWPPARMAGWRCTSTSAPWSATPTATAPAMPIASPIDDLSQRLPAGTTTRLRRVAPRAPSARRSSWVRCVRRVGGQRVETQRRQHDRDDRDDLKTTVLVMREIQRDMYDTSSSDRRLNTGRSGSSRRTSSRTIAANCCGLPRTISDAIAPGCVRNGIYTAGVWPVASAAAAAAQCRRSVKRCGGASGDALVDQHDFAADRIGIAERAGGEAFVDERGGGARAGIHVLNPAAAHERQSHRLEVARAQSPPTCVAAGATGRGTVRCP